MKFPRITRERRIQLVHDLPHWIERPEIDREALRRLAIKDRARAISSSHNTFTPQGIVEQEKTLQK